MGMLGRESLKKPVALKTAVVDVFDGQVKVRQLGFAQLLANVERAQEATGGDENKIFFRYRESLLFEALIDPEDDKPVFSTYEEALQVLGQWDLPSLDKVWAAANALNVSISTESITEEAKNSEAPSSEPS